MICFEDFVFWIYIMMSNNYKWYRFWNVLLYIKSVLEVCDFGILVKMYCIV